MTCVITTIKAVTFVETLSKLWEVPASAWLLLCRPTILATDVCYSSSIKHLSHTHTDSIVSELFNIYLHNLIVNDNMIYKGTKIVLLSFSPFIGLNATAVFVDFAAEVWRNN